MVMIVMSGVSAGYGDKVVIRDIDFYLSAGEVVGLVGPNGSGKTTLAYAILGLARIFSGEVRVDGFRLPRNVGDIRRLVRYLPQEPSSALIMPTVEDEILSGTYDGRGVDRGRAEQMLETWGLDPIREEHPLKISFGQQKRVLLATFLAGDPKYLILDEPFAGLDTEGRNELLKMLSYAREEGMGILLISHDAHALNFCDRMYYLRSGVMASPQKVECSRE
jgi:ABC-type multidrug transport system ATPase subunit